MKPSNHEKFCSFLVFGFVFLLFPVSAFCFNSHQPFDISSDILEYNDETNEITAEGHVVVVQSSSTLTADIIRYDQAQKRLTARGNVVLRENGTLLVGDQMDYDLQTQKGVVLGGKGYGSPWLFQGASWEKNKDFYIGRNASFTSCDLIDPHYHMKASRVHLIPDKLFWAWNNIFYIDKHPVFYSPFLYKSLGPRRIVFQAEPGNDTVKGAFAKTITTIRFKDGVYDKVLLDFYTVAGTGYGNEFNYSDTSYKGSLFGYYINPKGTPELVGAPLAPQYNLRFYHWQQLNEQMTFQSNVNHRKNVSFNNQFFSQDPNQSVTDVNNSNALTYQNKHINQRLVVESLEAPDAGSDPLFGQTHIQTSSLPRYEITQYPIPLWSPKVSTSTLDQMRHPNHVGALQFGSNGNFENYYSREDEQTRLKANGSASLSIPINLSRQWSFATSFSPSLRWQDKYDPFTPVTTSSGAIVIPTGIFRGYQGRLSGGANLRYRPLSALTLDQSYGLTARLTPNEFTLDRSLADGGIESNHLSEVLFWRPTRLVMLRSFSGYDLRKIANESLDQYRQRRIDPWTNEMTLDAGRKPWGLFFRHQLGYYPTRVMLWEVDARGQMAHKTLVQTGLSYNRSQAGLLTWNNKLGFYVSPSWRVDMMLNTLMPDAIGSLRDGIITQSEFIVIRDMHCWDIQFTYRNLPPLTKEFSFLFNLKLGAKAAKEITNPEIESQFYPWRAKD